MYLVSMTFITIGNYYEALDNIFRHCRPIARWNNFLYSENNRQSDVIDTSVQE